MLLAAIRVLTHRPLPFTLTPPAFVPILIPPHACYVPRFSMALCLHHIAQWELSKPLQLYQIVCVRFGIMDFYFNKWLW